jgi:hypothetical protein
MSYDFEIATHKKPNQSHLQEFVSKRNDLELVGSLESKERNVVVNRKKATSLEFLCNIGGPFLVEEEDVHEPLLAAVLAPRWLIQISLSKFAPKTEFAMVKAICRHIAERCQGAVFDPQLNAVIWPRGKSRRYIAPSAKERIRLVTLTWFLPRSQEEIGTSKSFLEIIDRFCPEARPVRFGTFEPFQERLDPKDDKSFLDFWQQVSKQEHGDILFFKSRAPCFGGSIFFPDKRTKPKNVGRAIRIELDFDGRALHSDSRWSETVILLFREMSKKLGAFYGSGHVERNVIAARNKLWFDNNSEDSPFPKGRWWFGLPPGPTWLAWFGGPYKIELKQFLKEQSTEIMDEGLFLCLGAEPMDVDQLEGIFPSLPSRFLAILGEVYPKEPEIVRDHDEWIRRISPKPAERIPDLE